MSADIHSDGLDTNRKTALQLDDRLTELTLVLKAIGVEELNMEDDQHYHLLNEEKKPTHKLCKHSPALCTKCTTR